MSSFRRSHSELKTAPDVRNRHKSKGKASHPLIPVLERRRMFEEVDSEKQYSGSNTRRGSRLTAKGKDISRSSSLRSSKRFKNEDGSPVLKNKQLSSGTLNIQPLWQRLRNFGHYDTQSMSIDSLASYQEGPSITKKPTGASAAVANDCTTEDVSNNLIAVCPAFKNEIGGDSDWLSEESPTLKLREQLSYEKQRRIGSRQRLIVDGDIPLKELVQSRGPMNQQVCEVLQSQTGIKYPFEFVDYGASYYRHYFLGQDHQNFFGVDEAIGPVAISLKREKVPEELVDFYKIPLSNNHIIAPPKHQWRVILRTSQLSTLRGTILEESIPTSSKIGTSKGIPPRDVVDYITQGEISAHSLRLGKNEKKVFSELVRLDEQELSNKYKIGVMYCKPGQTTEEEMYNNETGSPAFDEFLTLLGDRVRMKGFTKYRAQLDNKTDTTGEYSVYREFRDTELMFHVSTLLPYTASNKQQLLRKRHIGNDIVTLVFQEPGCEPFSPKCIRSHFQHIFIVVRVEHANTEHTKYRVAVTRSQDIPFFGPIIPEDTTFDKNDIFKEFVLTKLINACNASLRSEKFSKMAIRTRKQYLTDLAESATTQTLDQVSSGKVAGLLRSWSHRKLREKGRQENTLLFTPGAITWAAKLLLRRGKPLPFSEDPDYTLNCVMGMAPDFLTFMTTESHDMLLHLPMMNIAGWIREEMRINLFYDDSYCLSLECRDNDEDCAEICSRLHNIAPCLTPSHEASLMEFPRSSNGLLGFGINEAGVVQKVDGLAKSVGLQKNARILQVEDRLLCCHSHKQIMEVLTDRSRPTVRAYVVPPPPPSRPVQYYPALNWAEIWGARPNNPDSEADVRPRNGSVTPDPGESLRSHSRSVSNSNRVSYLEAMQSSDYDDLQKYGGPIDDSEPIYDRLVNKEALSRSPPPRARSPSHGSRRHDSMGYARINRKMKPSRESVVPFEFKSPDPEPMDYKVEEYSPGVRAKVAVSAKIPEHKAHIAAPLSEKFNSRKLPGKANKPMIEVSSPGQVTELTKKFLLPQGSPANKNIKTPKTALKATTSASEMTKTPAILPAQQTKVNGFDNDVKLRNGISGRKNRPSSWDYSNSSVHRRDHDLFIIKDDSTPSDQALMDETFHRNSNIRSAFRRRTASQGLSPEPYDSNPEASPAPDNDAALKLSDSPKLSQGSSGSQGPPMSVRERTMKWESRGGGVPSYFTLPRPLRNKHRNGSGIPTKTSSGTPQPSSRSPRTSVSSTSTTDTRTSSKRVTSREEADGSSNPDDSYEARSKTVPRKFKSKKVTVTVKSRRDSRENLLSPKRATITAIKTSASETTDKSEGSPQPEAPPTGNSVETPTVTDLESLSLNDKNTSNGDLGYKPRVEEWVRQTSQTALPLESVEAPPRDITSPTPTENSLFSQSDSLSQADKEMIESLRARVEFLEGKLEQESESKLELGEKLHSLESQLTNLTSKKRVKTIKTAMI